MSKSKTYTDNQIQWVKKFFDAEVKSIREAVDKVETTYASYRESQNEWRSQMKDQTARFITRRELLGAVVAIIGIMTSIIAILLNYLK